MRVSDNDQKRQGVEQKGKPPGRQGKGREPDKGGESTNDKKKKYRSREASTKHRSKKQARRRANSKDTRKQNEKERGITLEEEKTNIRVPPSESQKTNIGDPTLSSAQKTTPEHKNRIQQTKANPKQRGNPVKHCQ